MSEKRLASGQRRTLRALRKKLLDMSAAWDGLDQFNLGQFERLADECERVAIELLDDKPLEHVKETR